jgi:hypothetical protein
MVFCFVQKFFFGHQESSNIYFFCCAQRDNFFKKFNAQKQIRLYKKQTNTNYTNKISDKAGDYSGMRQHSLIFTSAAETPFPTTPIRNIIFKLVK